MKAWGEREMENQLTLANTLPPTLLDGDGEKGGRAGRREDTKSTHTVAKSWCSCVVDKHLVGEVEASMLTLRLEDTVTFLPVQHLLVCNVCVWEGRGGGEDIINETQ